MKTAPPPAPPSGPRSTAIIEAWRATNGGVPDVRRFVQSSTAPDFLKRDVRKMKDSQIHDVLMTQVDYQISRPRRNVQVFEGFSATRTVINDLHQIDLVDMKKYPFDQQINSKHPERYILTVVDAHSRYACAIALVRKDSKSVSDALRLIWNTRPGNGALFRPVHVSADGGGEFKGDTERLCAELGIDIRIETVVEAMGLVGGFHRKLQERLGRAVVHDVKKNVWAELLPHTVALLNESRVKTIRASPMDVYLGITPARPYFKKVTSRLRTRQSAMKVGDYVRVRLDFSKRGDPIRSRVTDPRWSDFVGVISHVIESDAVDGLKRYSLYYPATNEYSHVPMYADELLRIPSYDEQYELLQH